jgi:hypothetical protein
MALDRLDGAIERVLAFGCILRRDDRARPVVVRGERLELLIFCARGVEHARRIVVPELSETLGRDLLVQHFCRRFGQRTGHRFRGASDNIGISFALFSVESISRIAAARLDSRRKLLPGRAVRRGIERTPSRSQRKSPALLINHPAAATDRRAAP